MHSFNMQENAAPFRPSTLEERKEFYKKEFSIKKVENWFRENKISPPQLCAIDAGTDSRIIKNKSWHKKLFYFKFSQLKEKIAKYCPEDIYYDRNTYENPEQTLDNLDFSGWQSQELTFDLDADNLDCKCRDKKEICNECLNKLWNYSLKLKKYLKNKGFTKTTIIYSGRGFHVHVFDKKSYTLTKTQRNQIVKEFSKFPLDPWVSQGGINLIRMPYSLHGLVSRKCLPVKTNFKTKDTLPLFLRI